MMWKAGSKTWGFKLACLVLLGGCSVEIPKAFYQTSTDVEDTDVEGSLEPDTTDSTDTSLDVNEGGEEAPECNEIADCAKEEFNPCIQPSCVAGICGEQAAPVGTECQDSGLDTLCATGTCNLIGECEFDYIAQGTSCSPDEEGGGSAPSVCTVYGCDGSGICALNNVPDGLDCTASDTPCAIKNCTGGICIPNPEICSDGYSCSHDLCITHNACSLEDGAPVTPDIVDECAFAMYNGEEANIKTYTLNIQGGEGDEGYDLFVSWCNTQYANEGVHNGEGCLPGKDWSAFTDLLEGLELGEANTLGVCAAEPIHATCDDSNSCTVDSCDPNIDLSPGNGCTYEALELNTLCDGKEFCYGEPGVCELDEDSGISCTSPPKAIGNLCDLNESPCTQSVCNPNNGKCTLTPSWNAAEAEPTPLCSLQSGPDSTGIEFSDTQCLQGNCEACQDGQPNCKGARCVPVSPLGLPCETMQDCMGYKDAAPIQWLCLEGTCQIPCNSWNPDCKKCLNGTTPGNCPTFFIGICLDMCGDGAFAQSVPGEVPAEYIAEKADQFYDECLLLFAPEFLPMNEEILKEIMSEKSCGESLFPSPELGCIAECFEKAVVECFNGPCQKQCLAPVNGCEALEPSLISGGDNPDCATEKNGGAITGSVPVCGRPCLQDMGQPVSYCAAEQCVPLEEL